MEVAKRFFFWKVILGVHHEFQLATAALNYCVVVGSGSSNVYVTILKVAYDGGYYYNVLCRFNSISNGCISRWPSWLWSCWLVGRHLSNIGPHSCCLFLKVQIGSRPEEPIMDFLHFCSCTYEVNINWFCPIFRWRYGLGVVLWEVILRKIWVNGVGVMADCPQIVHKG